MMIFHWKLVVYFILASSATIGSCGDFCDTGSMYFFMAHPFFDALEVYEQVIDRFQAPKHIHRHLFDQHVDRGAVLLPRARSKYTGPGTAPISFWGPRKRLWWHWNVFKPSKTIDNLLNHFQNIAKWMSHGKIHWSCAAEVPTAPNSRRGSQDKKNTR